MMDKIKRICVCLLAAGLLCTPCVADEQTGAPSVATEYVHGEMYNDFESDSQATVPTTGSAAELQVSATSAILLEGSTGRVLYEKNADERRSPASITKVMTLLLTMEAIENGKIALTDRVVATAHACSMGGSQIWLEEGEVMTVDHLIKAVCVASANDAAVALGEHIAGSEEAFVARMNQRASELGMKDTVFVNCCGLDAPDHLTTARDIGIMSRALIAHPLITEYSTIWMDTLRNGETQLVNTNKLVRFYEGATGLKTGTTDDAGYCVTATARKNGMDLIAVVLDGETSDKRFSDAKQLLNFGFANWAVAEGSPEQALPSIIGVKGGVTDKVGVICEPNPTFLVEKGKGGQIVAKMTVAQSAQAPVVAGQIVGKISYLLDNQVIGEQRLLAARDVEKRGFWFSFCQMVKGLFEL